MANAVNAADAKSNERNGEEAEGRGGERPGLLAAWGGGGGQEVVCCYAWEQGRRRNQPKKTPNVTKKSIFLGIPECITALGMKVRRLESQFLFVSPRL